MQSDEKTTYDELLWSVHYWQVSGKIPNLDETSASNYQKKNGVIGILSNEVEATFTRGIVKGRIPYDSCQNKKF
jgi:hypothetical protein